MRKEFLNLIFESQRQEQSGSGDRSHADGAQPSP
jgi:hypothetical protein